MKRFALVLWLCIPFSMMGFAGCVKQSNCPATCSPDKPCKCDDCQCKPICGCKKPSTQRDALDSILDAYVELGTNQGTGAGTVCKFGDKIAIITAKHVVKGTNLTATKRYDGKVVTFECKVIWSHDTLDLAICQPVGTIQGLGRPIEWIAGNLVQGDEVWYIGTPSSFHGMLERGIVQGVNFSRYDSTWTVVSGNGWYGSSGGGLFVIHNGTPTLAGVCCVILDTSRPNSPVGFMPPGIILKALTGGVKCGGC